MRLQSYRFRLVIYMFLLIGFLSATVIYSYGYASRIIHQAADGHLDRLVQLLDAHLNQERNELQRYATLVSQDLRLKEYMYVITEVGGDSKPLDTLYEREFGWLPIDQRLILSMDGKVVAGTDDSKLASEVQTFVESHRRGIFYHQGEHGLEVVSVSPIRYRETILGFVAVSRNLNDEWFESSRRASGGDFFLVQNGQVVKSTLPDTRNFQINQDNNSLIADSVLFRISKIDLPGNRSLEQDIWFGFSEDQSINELERQHNVMLALVSSGVAGILLIGLLFIRNFNGPLNRIKDLTSKVAEGELPSMNKHRVSNEFDELSNHFADMLHALREQKVEIDIAQKKLQQIAITDSMTGLYNRRYLDEIFPKLVAQTEREGLAIHVIIFDLDHFKQINDQYGHMAGDQCLVTFSNYLKDKCRVSDYLFRLGGEEFLILSINKNIMEAASFADKLRAGIETIRVAFEDTLISMTVSGGISPAIKDGSIEKTLEQVLSRADRALYKAKSIGRNRVCIMNPADNNENLIEPASRYCQS